MQAILAMMVCMASSVSSSSYTAMTLPDVTNEDFIQECVQTHNQYRSKVNPTATNMLYMTWDPELARIAKSWAKVCRFSHNPQLKSGLHPNFTSVGENIWTGSLTLFSASSAISDWYDEIKNYDFTTRRCSNVCGHYTQVVWADSYKVGCAVQFCPKVTNFASLSNGAHFVCNYGPGGNYPTWPYNQGPTCSDCPKDDRCLNNLCINPQRDRVSRMYANLNRLTGPCVDWGWGLGQHILRNSKSTLFVSQVTTLVTIQEDPPIYVTDTHLSFSLLRQSF
ncbi:glioma pathogenesis-related protein 1 isoform X1 [Mesocricetus auratus]|uniref:Glioma pathogenesis-related protein 1 isoform X1 n=1 Tax=Mesocricetus auratus TaxID=10036 RepID=A0ABM2Y7Z8_MESAU|nr:glioma pathogenesis-related protein 1 isoform X1 [Mesocricetus auratus]XP_040610824.1 glioma pathogenesis-related protein 1 isoform X1 [Mesocricetus auratus]XP_040610825.1 glioma pathogenesis-related protein 1 isoform X1 [Mesocricetus auratus]XP_040610826.1 glioma pathogenesis-related protein 1 isoform X1 [Mesocricetus auratus]XP_040610827.1 glioma pathogenesis-related protein 1 isoform X1 [Mesocricetus auratus]